MESILIVDDEPVIRALLEIVLNRAGFNVLTAGCGGEAISLSQSHRNEIALLITDVTLPGMTGWTLASELIKADPEFPVLFISGGCVEADFEKRDCADFLAKPFSLSSLLMDVRKLLAEVNSHGVN
jgi:DNA-binding NtrC family response regulator